MPIPPYPTDELESRISDGSIDQTRLAASVLELQTTMTAIVNWINQQQVPASSPAASPEPESAISTGGNGKGAKG